MGVNIAAATFRPIRWGKANARRRFLTLETNKPLPQFRLSQVFRRGPDCRRT